MTEPLHDGEAPGVPAYLGGGSSAPEPVAYQADPAFDHSTAIEPAGDGNGSSNGSNGYSTEKSGHHTHLQLDGEGIHKVDSRGNSVHDHEKQGIAGGHGPHMEDGVIVGEKRGANVVILGGMDPTSKDGMVHRRLHTRQVSMIAIGGCIGTGLFIGSGASYSASGPLGILLGYSIMGVIVWAMMIALGEMVTMYPVSGAFTHYAARFVDPALGFAVGWNYAYSYAITLPTEVTAAAVAITYWNTSISPAVWITIFLVPIYAFNFLGVQYYGEAEFWMSLIKVITIVGLIILDIIISAGGTPAGVTTGFQYWRNPGPFQQLDGIAGAKGRFLAFWSIFVQAAFSYLGTEIVALAAGETSNPRRNMPRAIRRVFFRILLFYVLGVFVIGITVDPNNPLLLSTTNNASASPFVIAIQGAGINSLPSIVNAVILISAFSAGNSDLYASSRTLYGLSLSGQTPRFFRYCSRRGIPYFCVIFCALLGPLAYLNVSETGGQVFEWFYNISAITGLLTWWAITLTYIRFWHGLKYQGISRDDFVYKAPLQPYMSYFAFFMFTIIIFFNGFNVFLVGNFDASDFLTAYITLPIFAGFYLFWKIYKRPGFVRLQDMDFETGKRELDQIDREEQEAYEQKVNEQPRFYNSWVSKIFGWII